MQSNTLDYITGSATGLAAAGSLELDELISRDANAEIAARLADPGDRNSTDVRDRLLQVSAEFFARDGFNRTSVREICRAARANVASIRYYFGSKLGLYRELLLGSARTAIEMHPMPVLDENEDGVAGIRTWVAHLIQLKLRDGFEDVLMCRLISHEMHDPSPALDDVVDLLFAPFHREMEKAISRLLEGNASTETLKHLSLQLTALSFQYAQRKNVLHRMNFELPKTAEELEALIDYVTKFFIAGARAVGGK